MAKPATVTALQDRLATITRFRERDLVARQDWGQINFEDAGSDIDLVLSIANDLSSMPVEFLTEQSASAVLDAIPAVTNALEAIDGFQLSGNVDSNRANATNSLRNAAEALHTRAAIWIPYLAYRRGDVAQNIQQLHNAITDAQRIRDEAKIHADVQTAEVEEIVAKARDAAAEAGVATFTHAFGRESDRVRKASLWWLTAAAIGAGATVAWAVASYFWPAPPEDANVWESTRLMFAKVSVVAILFTATIWCGRMYRALRHLETVNKHRALGLQTFQAFTAAAADDQTKAAVLMATANSIFDNVPTGLADHPSRSDMRIVDLAQPVARVSGDRKA